jgi:hypothetical protein
MQTEELLKKTNDQLKETMSHLVKALGRLDALHEPIADPMKWVEHHVRVTYLNGDVDKHLVKVSHE